VVKEQASKRRANMRGHIARTVGVALSGLFLTLTFVQAGTINQRERNQQRRIDQGIGSGQLTRHEAGGLEREQVHIHRDEARAKADRVFTPRERARIQAEQNRASCDIYRQKHDNQTRN
jgi:hypothetical protein